MQPHQTLRVESRDHITALTLTRPEVLNRFDPLQEQELVDALTAAAADPLCRVVLLLAEGRVFSAGGDFELMLAANRDPSARGEALDSARRMLTALTTLPQPLVVGVQGAAMGLGATVVLAADVVVAASRATIADTHVAIGLVAGDGGVVFWPQSAGMLRARRYLLTGDPIDGRRAYEIGLVTDLVDEPSEVPVAALGIARRIAALPPLAVQGTKRALNRLTRQQSMDVAETALVAEGHTLASADLVEAIGAFREKRPGVFTGQ